MKVGLFCRTLALFAAMTAGLALTGTNADAAVEIARDGKTNAVIVENGFKDSATSLQEYLKKMTGAEPRIVADENAAPTGAPRIVLQKVAHITGSSAGATARQAYRIQTQGNVLRLSGASDKAVDYAVWGLLEDHLGCHFYTARTQFMKYLGPDLEVVPSQPTVSLDKINDFQEPAFAMRGYVWLNAAQPERWPPERAAPWAYSALALAVMFLGLFIYCVVTLVREANRKRHEVQSAT